MALITIQLDTRDPDDAADFDLLYHTMFAPAAAAVTEAAPIAPAATKTILPTDAQDIAGRSHGSPEPEDFGAKELAGPALDTPERDSAGLPWDARIHSDSRALTAEGAWRRRRGVEQSLVDSVTAELRQTAQPTAPSVPLPPAPPAITPSPPAPPAITPSPPELAAPAPIGRGVADLAAAVARGSIKLDDLNAACLSNGCANVLELSRNPVAMAAVCAKFDSLGAFIS